MTTFTTDMGTGRAHPFETILFQLLFLQIFVDRNGIVVQQNEKEEIILQMPLLASSIVR